MVDLLSDGFILICGALLLWGLVKVDRIYQYPFFMAGIFIAFIQPQIKPLLQTTTVALLSPAAYVRVLVMACLCVAMCGVGYAFQPRRQWLDRLQIPLDDQKLLHLGCLFALVGWVTAFLTTAYINTWEGGGQLSGAGTIYIFLNQVIYIAFAIFLIEFLQRPRPLTLAGTLLSAYPIIQTVLAGRRQPTLTFLVIVGFSIWLVRRKLPSRWLILVMVLAGIYLIPLIADLRAEFWRLIFRGDWQTLQATAQSSFTDLQEGDNLDLRNALVLMDATDQSGQFGFGTGLWDAVVFQFVPGQLVGAGLKQSLQFNWTPLQQLYDLYGYSSYLGSVITGIGDAFMQFWYFGCLLYALVGYLFKHLWLSAVYRRSMVASLLMISLISPAMISVSHGWGRFGQEAVFQLGVTWLIVAYARVKPKPADVVPESSLSA